MAGIEAHAPWCDCWWYVWCFGKITRGSIEALAVSQISYKVSFDMFFSYLSRDKDLQSLFHNNPS